MLENIIIIDALGVLIALLIAPFLIKLFPKRSITSKRKEFLNNKFLMQSKTDYYRNRGEK